MSDQAQKRKKYQKKYYEAHKEKVKENSRRAREKFHKKWTEFKASLSCTKCGESHPAALDFHHIVRSKTNKKVFKLVHNHNWTDLMLEIDKCVVLCANCHRKHHAEEKKLKGSKKSKKKKP